MSELQPSPEAQLEGAASLEELEPNTQHAARECHYWRERMESYAATALADAKAAEAAGDVERSVLLLSGSRSWAFGARALARAAGICTTIEPYEAEVRALILKLRAKPKPRAARAQAAE